MNNLRYKLFSVAMAFFTSAKSAHAATAELAPAFDTGEFMKVALALLATIACILFLSAILKKLNLVNTKANSAMSIISTLSLNSKERILLLEVGEEQIVLSASPGNIRKLHVLAKPIAHEVSVEEGGSGSDGAPHKFSDLLHVIGKGKT